MNSYVISFAGNYAGLIEARSIEEAVAQYWASPHYRKGARLHTADDWYGECASARFTRSADSDMVRIGVRARQTWAMSNGVEM